MTEIRQSVSARLSSGSSPQISSHLFEYLAAQQESPPERRIFVNRTLRMESVRFVGFDLDWTLADYRRLPLERITIALALERLISHHGYPEEIRAVELRPDFTRRGLLIDKEAGTVLRMNRHRFVNRAYLGRRRLDRSELKRLYRYEPIHPASTRFYHLDSLFELPEANLFAELIELSRSERPLVLPPPWQIFDDVRASIDWVHAQGSLKNQVLAATPDYLDRDIELVMALLRLALSGRRLILLTNSELAYAQGICSYLFDNLVPGIDSWRDLFDLILVSTGKPDFFRTSRPFVTLDSQGNVKGETRQPEWGGIYARGSLEGLMALIREPGESVLYIGDHIYGDIVTSKQQSTWRTALIVRELEDEIHQLQQLSSALDKSRELRRQLAAFGHRMDHVADLVRLSGQMGGGAFAPDENSREQLEEELLDVTRRHREVMREETEWSERSTRTLNPYWGSFFKQGTSKTRFAAQLENYSCLYTSRVSNFAFYGTNRYFRVLGDAMVHELRANGEP